MQGLGRLVDELIEQFRLQGKVSFDFRRLSLSGVNEKQEKVIVKTINQYVAEQGCGNYHIWNRWVVAMLMMQLVCLLWQFLRSVVVLIS